MPLLSRSTGAVSLFDVRLTNAHKNVIVLRGSPGNAASIHLTGNVVLSLTEPLSIKRISLRIYGKLRLQWTDTSTISRTGAARHYRYESTVYEKDWPNLELASGSLEVPANQGNSGNTANSSSNNNNNTSANGSSNNTSSSLALLSSSSSSHGSSTPSSSHTLAQGNHEFPFETIIPGSIDESVEGLDGGHVVYRIVATIERGRFANNVTCKRHLRVVRTLGSDVLELSQSVSIDNTWPQKIDYSISIPNKALAVGSLINISMELSPLLKGLRLGSIRILLAEQVSLATPTGGQHQYERCVVEHIIPAPADGLRGRDMWSIRESFALPANLAKCTQDCVVHSSIKVGHKLKFAVSLKNPDGHTSELRASLPVYVFISPNVPVRAPDSSRTVIFDHQQTLPMGSNVVSGDLLEVNAPPNYANHVYDRLWSDIAPANFDSPIHSGAATPLHSRSRRNSNDQLGASGLGMTPASHQPLSDAHARSLLVDNLRQLQMEQRAQQGQGADDSAPISQGRASGSNSNNDSGTNLQGLYATNSSDSDNSNGSSSSANNNNNNGITITARQTLAAACEGGEASAASASGGSALSRAIASAGLHGALPDQGSPIIDTTILSAASNGGPGSSSLASALSSTDLMGATPQSPDVMHLSYPVSPSLSSAPSHAQLEVLSRVPSYQTAISSDSPVGFEEAPQYEASLSHVPSSTSSMGAAASQAIAGPRRSARSVTNLSSSPLFSPSTPQSGNPHLRKASQTSRSATHLRDLVSSHFSARPGSSGNGASSSARTRSPSPVGQQPSPIIGHVNTSAGASTNTFLGAPLRVRASSSSTNTTSGAGAELVRSRQTSPSTAVRTPRNGGASDGAAQQQTPAPAFQLPSPSRAVTRSSSSSSRARSQSTGATPLSPGLSAFPASPGNNNSNNNITTSIANSSASGLAPVPPTLVENEITEDFSSAGGLSTHANGSSTPSGSTSSFGSFMRARNASFSKSASILGYHGSSSGSGSGSSTPGLAYANGAGSSSSNLAAQSNGGGRHRVRSGGSSANISGTSTPTFTNSQRTNSTRSLLEEATKFLHLSKSPAAAASTSSASATASAGSRS